MADLALEAAASALFEDFHINGHSLNDFESATAARIAVTAFVDSLLEGLPEEAVRAAAIALYPTERDESLDAEAADGIGAFLRSLRTGLGDGQ